MAGLDLAFPSPGTAPSVNKFNGTRSWQMRRRLLEPWREAVGWAWRTTPPAQRTAIQGKPCSVTVTIPFTQKRTRDPHNYVTTVVKAMIDQLVKQDVWPDDSPEWITVVEPVLVIGKDCIVHLEPR